MTLVVLGIDALDFELVQRGDYPNLALAQSKEIETIDSAAGKPSTHEIWPSIITGLPPNQHGITLESDGVAWGNTFLDTCSWIANYTIPDSIQTNIGSWVLSNTTADAFRTPRSYYTDNSISTVFDDIPAVPIGIPNYIVDSTPDGEHQLRQDMGELFQRDASLDGASTADPTAFYHRCMEMCMIRFARARRALRRPSNQLVFAYTSGLDLIGHVAHSDPKMQTRAYSELDGFVGEVLSDLSPQDELLLVSDHGLQDGVHTHTAMVSATSESLIGSIDSVLDVRSAIQTEIQQYSGGNHSGGLDSFHEPQSAEVREHLKNLGYM